MPDTDDAVTTAIELVLKSGAWKIVPFVRGWRRRGRLLERRHGPADRRGHRPEFGQLVGMRFVLGAEASHSRTAATASSTGDRPRDALDAHRHTPHCQRTETSDSLTCSLTSRVVAVHELA